MGNLKFEYGARSLDYILFKLGEYLTRLTYQNFEIVDVIDAHNFLIQSLYNKNLYDDIIGPSKWNIAFLVDRLQKCIKDYDDHQGEMSEDEFNDTLYDEIYNDIVHETDYEIDYYDAKVIKGAAERLRCSIGDSLLAQGISLTPEGDYKINLLDKPKDMFPKNLITLIPEVEQDILEFEEAFTLRKFPNSCGMLLCRIFEVTLKEFGSHLESKPNHIQKNKKQEDKKYEKYKKEIQELESRESENQENQDDEIKEIKIKAINDVMQKLKNYNDEESMKLYGYLLIIRNEYRNKLMHGEMVFKNMDEVKEIFHAVYNVLFLILKDIPMVKNSTVNDTNNCEK